MTSAAQRLTLLQQHVSKLHDCRICPNMVGAVVSGPPVLSPILFIGQAPGVHEERFGKPFAWTAGKTLFRWFDSIGMEEEFFRARVYMAAVARRFPGKAKAGGDRVPSPQEIDNCRIHLKTEVAILKPELVIPVGRLAISQLLPFETLAEVIGGQHRVTFHGHDVDVVPLPHPSGASTWHRTEPGKTLLQLALTTLSTHAAWKKVLANK